MIEEQYDEENGWLAWLNSPEGAALMNSEVTVYRCPSRVGWEGIPDRRDYFGVAGGINRIAVGRWGDVHEDGVYHINSPVKMGRIIDGTSHTLGIGESVGLTKYGNGDGYADEMVGGPSSWWHGAACLPRDNACNDSTQSYQRCLRTTKLPINSLRLELFGRPRDNQENDTAFSSDHPSGALFVYIDGHVELVQESIDQDTYQALSTFGGDERIESGGLPPR